MNSSKVLCTHVERDVIQRLNWLFKLLMSSLFYVQFEPGLGLGVEDGECRTISGTISVVTLRTDTKTDNWSNSKHNWSKKSCLQLIEKQTTDRISHAYNWSKNRQLIEYQAQLIEKVTLTTDRKTDDWSNSNHSWSKKSRLELTEKQTTDRISSTTDRISHTYNWSNSKHSWSKKSRLELTEKQTADRISSTTDRISHTYDWFQCPAQLMTKSTHSSNRMKKITDRI